MLILASGSPRRKELIELLGIPFCVEVSQADENLKEPLPPDETVKELSFRKAEAVAKNHKNEIVLGVDTVVFCGGQILGKPKNEEDAKRMLRLLSGRTHEVYSGFTLIKDGKRYSESVCTSVHFSVLSENEIDAYIASGEPMDKAGAYGIQGKAAKFVVGIEGDYHSVVGLPVQRIYKALCDEYGVTFS